MSIFLTLSALPQNYFLTILNRSNDCLLIFFYYSLILVSFICYNLLHVDCANLANFFFNLYLYYLSDAKSFPAYYTCLRRYFHLIPVWVGY